MSVTPEDLQFLQTLQQRILNNEVTPREDLKKGIEIARRWRSAPSTKAAKSTTASTAAPKKAAVQMSMDDINKMFANLGQGKPNPK